MAHSFPEGTDFLKSLDKAHQTLRGQEQLASSLAKTLAKLCTETEELVNRCKGPQPKVEDHIEDGLALVASSTAVSAREESNTEDMTFIGSQCISSAVFEDQSGTSPSSFEVFPGSNSAPVEDLDAHPCLSDTPRKSDTRKSINAAMLLTAPRNMFINDPVTRLRLSDFANEVEKKKCEEDGIFVDAEELKDEVRKHLAQSAYDTCHLYKKTGFAQAIVRTSAFEWASIALLVTSSLWIAVAMDLNHAVALHESALVFQIGAHLFCVGFLVEAILRILAFKSFRDAARDFWCVFDTLLVICLIFETWILGAITAISGNDFTGGRVKTVIVFRVLRLMRLMRVLRLVRLLRFMPQLMVIVRGLGIALRAVACVLILLLIIIYAGAIVARGLFEGSQFGDEWFSSVLASMGTLMLECTLSGNRGTGLMRQAYAEHPLYAFLLLLFVLLANVTMMGILAGVLVQTVKTVAEVEKEEKTVRDLVKTIEYIWVTVLKDGTDSEGQISAAELRALFSVKDTARIMRTMDVDVEGLVSVADFIFDQKKGRLGWKDFLKLVLNLRGSKKATVKDHIETRRFIHSQIQDLAQGRGRGSGSNAATPSLRRASHAMRRSI